MSSLMQSGELNLYPQSPQDGYLITHPGVGRKIDCFQTEHDFNLYLERDDFINANSNHEVVTLKQVNETEQNTLLVRNKIKKALGNPRKVKLFRKNENLLILPLDTKN